jgi:hypothetical protein
VTKATEEGLEATFRVMSRGCSICCAFGTVFILIALVLSISAPNTPLTLDEGLVLLILMVLTPMLAGVILYRMSRQKRDSLTDT